MAAVATLAALAVFVIRFIESGSDHGLVTLNAAAAYPPGTVTHVRDQGFLVVHLGGDLFALSDDDPAAEPQGARRCRVRVLDAGEPEATALVEANRSRISPAAAGAETVIVGNCGGAVYDVAGIRLDVDGPNLGRLGVSVDGSGRLIVDTQARTCTRRTGTDLGSPVSCAGR